MSSSVPFTIIPNISRSLIFPSRWIIDTHQIQISVVFGEKKTKGEYANHHCIIQNWDRLCSFICGYIFFKFILSYLNPGLDSPKKLHSANDIHFVVYSSFCKNIITDWSYLIVISLFKRRPIDERSKSLFTMQLKLQYRFVSQLTEYKGMGKY